MGLRKQEEGSSYIFFEESWNIPASPPDEQGEHYENKHKRKIIR